jgi:orotate phosphoribosyltransferase
LDKEKIVDVFIETEALLSGHFILTSGKHSPSYFQCAKVLQYPKYLTSFASMIADNFISTKIDAVISPAIGGIVLGTEVGRLLNTKTIFAERKNGAMCIRRGFNIKKNQNILVVEDVITTGGSVKEVMNEVTKLGGLISGVAILVDRSNGTINLHKNQYSIVELEVVSYDADSVPNNLKEIPVQKPGSRKTQ